jgi:hypothetical protein
MHKCLLLALFLPLSVFAAETNDGWTRIQSDDREFSIEMPDTLALFRDDDGFTISRANSADLLMKKMVLASAVVDGTLLTVESYDVGKAALDSIYEADQRFRTKLQKSTEKRDGFSIHVLTDEMPNAFLKKEYFYSKNRIYILTAGARSGETSEMKRFGLRGGILGEGLARQAVFAAIRIRYLPPASGPDAMKAVTKQVEYSFSIY